MPKPILETRFIEYASREHASLPVPPTFVTSRSSDQSQQSNSHNDPKTLRLSPLNFLRDQSHQSVPPRDQSHHSAPTTRKITSKHTHHATSQIKALPQRDKSHQNNISPSGQSYQSNPPKRPITIKQPTTQLIALRTRSAQFLSDFPMIM